MTRVDVQEATTRLSQLMAAAERGEEVVIARGGRPVVRLVPVGEPAPRPVGFVAGSVPEALPEPLPDDETGPVGVTSVPPAVGPGEPTTATRSTG